MNNRLCVSVSEAAELLGISRPSMYKLIGRADFPSFLVDKRRLIPVSELESWVSKQLGAPGEEAC